MKKSVNIQKVDYTEELITVTIHGDDCVNQTIDGRVKLIELLKMVVNDPGLIVADTLTPDVMEIRHDGEKWILKTRTTKHGQTTERIKGLK